MLHKPGSGTITGSLIQGMAFVHSVGMGPASDVVLLRRFFSVRVLGGEIFSQQAATTALNLPPT